MREIKWLLLAQELNFDEAAFPLSFAIGYGSLGEIQKRDENVNEALLLLNSHLQKKPDDQKAHYNRGIIYYIQGDPEAAIEEYQSVVQSNSQFYVAYLSMSDALITLGRYDEASALLQDTIRDFEADGETPPGHI